jgi:riboflavin synthase
MFTGIVEEVGKVRAVVPGNMSIGLTVECKRVIGDVKIGDSISVNGICLTVTSVGNMVFTADVMPETMRKTNLKHLKAGERINLERALRLSDRLGGHLVSGHIDGTGLIASREEEDNAIWITIRAEPHILKYIVQKGSVALDGTSLTIAFVDDKCFKVSLIPLTAATTILGLKKAGDMINIECDVMGKYVEKLLYGRQQGNEGAKEGLSLDYLRENGFV